jgi:hypothetical protein
MDTRRLGLLILLSSISRDTSGATNVAVSSGLQGYDSVAIANSETGLGEDLDSIGRTSNNSMRHRIE